MLLPQLHNSSVVLYLLSLCFPYTGAHNCRACIHVRWQVTMTLYGAKLTANLTVAALSLPVKGIPDLPKAQLGGLVGSICSQGGAAYTSWLKSQYPNMQLNEAGLTTEMMLAELEAGRCDGLILIAPKAREFATKDKYCRFELSLIGEPLPFGPQDMAVGVRKDLPDVTAALSFWIEQLRQCSPDIPGVCYNAKNMAGLVEKWLSSSGGCDGKASDHSLGPGSFMHVFLLVWILAALVFILELIQPRARDRMFAIAFGHGLMECAISEPFACVNGRGIVDIKLLRKRFKATLTKILYGEPAAKTDSMKAYDTIMLHLRRYLVGPDTAAWQLLIGMIAELKKEFTVAQAEAIHLKGWMVWHVHMTLESKYSGSDKENRAAATIALYWLHQARRRIGQMRIEGLVNAQETMLVNAVAQLRVEEQRKRRDEEYRRLTSSQKAPRKRNDHEQQIGSDGRMNTQNVRVKMSAPLPALSTDAQANTMEDVFA